MEFQIILLPRKDYWSWVRACRDYVLAYGPNLTSDPITAAGYMAPRQVITFPLVSGGYPEQGDVERWFQTHHPGIRLDTIEAENPSDLSEELAARIVGKDRYGQKRRPFYLLWPTDSPVITQGFRVNPQIYSRWGFPGHEGIDFRARPKTNIYACADGEVYRVHLNPDNHPYGIHVRIRHKDGYKTIYCHFAKSLVSEGQSVEAGQVIGLADSTGASTGSHLHLSLKRDGATERGETDYPKDIIDPSPYLVWPEAASAKMIHTFDWAAGKCLIGAHGRIGGVLEEQDIELVAKSRLEALTVNLKESEKTIERLRADIPSIFLLARVTADFSSAPVSHQAFIELINDDIDRLCRLGIRYYEIHTNPNLQIEGWQRSWNGGEEFSRWFVEVVRPLRQGFPKARFGFPGLSPGGVMSGWRADERQFLYEAEEAVDFADWLGVHCYWTDNDGMSSIDGGRRYDEYRRRFQDKLIFITEFHNPSTEVGAQVKGKQYLEYYRMMRAVPGIAAVFAYALSAVDGYDAVTWRVDDGGETEIPAIIGGRSF